MKVLVLKAALALAVIIATPMGASADPWKDESGHGRWRGGYDRNDGYPGRGYGYGRERRFERNEFPGRAYGNYGERRQRRAFKEKYDDGNCKIERKWERNGEYKEERKCRGGYPSNGDRR
jgi:hypothetical protein